MDVQIDCTSPRWETGVLQTKIGSPYHSEIVRAKETEAAPNNDVSPGVTSHHQSRLGYSLSLTLPFSDFIVITEQTEVKVPTNPVRSDQHRSDRT